MPTLTQPTHTQATLTLLTVSLHSHLQSLYINAQPSLTASDLHSHAAYTHTQPTIYTHTQFTLNFYIQFTLMLHLHSTHTHAQPMLTLHLLSPCTNTQPTLTLKRHSSCTHIQAYTHTQATLTLRLHSHSLYTPTAHTHAVSTPDTPVTLPSRAPRRPSLTPPARTGTHTHTHTPPGGWDPLALCRRVLGLVGATVELALGNWGGQVGPQSPMGGVGG